jgi:N-dimethylarginine dimethylaminohydrolase
MYCSYRLWSGCNILGVCQSFRTDAASIFNFEVDFAPEDGVSTFLQNIGTHLPDCIAVISEKATQGE